MFNEKQKELFSRKKIEVKTPDKKPKKENAFLKAGRKASVTTTALGNGAIKVTTTDNDFVDQFAKATIYKKPRSYAEIAKDMELLWSQNPLDTVKLSLYLRLITRVVQVSESNYTEESQRGQGLKNEGIVRILWLAINHKSTFYKNLPLFVACGSWHDIFQLLSYDVQYNGWNKRKLEWFEICQFVLAGLQDPSQSELIKKYLPTIVTDTKCNTLHKQANNIIGKYLCSLLFGTKDQIFDPEIKESSGTLYKKYRLLKSSGTAHEWQKIISQKRMNDLNFDKIHGRALNLLVKSKFLKNNDLTAKYSEWIKKKPTAKYTGFVYELFKPLLGLGVYAQTIESHVEETINKQFLGLVETAKNGMAEGENSFIVMIDNSGSMESTCQGTGVSAYLVAKSMALYFSYLLHGPFADHFLAFSDDTTLKQWKGSTPVNKFRNENDSEVAGTNFLSVADHFEKVLNKGIPESEFPKGLICISDGCFNSTGSNKSNFRELLDRLRKAGFSKSYVDNFKVILWDIPNTYYSKKGQQAFEDFADTPNLFHIGGLDGAAIAFVTGTKHETKPVQTSEELFEAAMNQEVLNLVEI